MELHLLITCMAFLEGISLFKDMSCLVNIGLNLTEVHLVEIN